MRNNERKAMKKERKSAGISAIDHVVRNWRTVPLNDLVDACKTVHGAKYLLRQRTEVVEKAKSKGIRPGDLVDEIIAIRGTR